jgi:hypothetical protein
MVVCACHPNYCRKHKIWALQPGLDWDKSETLSTKITRAKKGCQCNSSNRVPAQQALSTDVKYQYHQKNFNDCCLQEFGWRLLVRRERSGREVQMDGLYGCYVNGLKWISFEFTVEKLYWTWGAKAFMYES